MVVKVNEADGSVLKSSFKKMGKKAPLRNKDRIVKLNHLCNFKRTVLYSYSRNNEIKVQYLYNSASLYKDMNLSG